MKHSAKDSPIVRKMRKKLKRKIAAESRKFNSRKLAKVTSILHKQLLRQGSKLFSLKSKSIDVLTQNERFVPAQSQWICEVRNRLITELEESKQVVSLLHRVMPLASIAK